MIQLLVIYYSIYFFVIYSDLIKTKKDFWITITPLSILIYPIIGIIKWFKNLK